MSLWGPSQIVYRVGARVRAPNQACAGGRRGMNNQAVTGANHFTGDPDYAVMAFERAYSC
jgi:hypothetical protein